MVQEGRKKEWVSPELTILVRKKPGALLFSGCHRAAGGAGSDQSNADQRCVAPPDAPGQCNADCFSAVVS
jgi:hypothetical protein